MCNNCDIKHTKLYECAGCKNKLYCGKKCQKEDWVSKHKSECIYNYGYMFIVDNKTGKEMRCEHLEENIYPIIELELLKKVIVDTYNGIKADVEIKIVKYNQIQDPEIKKYKIITNDLTPFIIILHK